MKQLTLYLEWEIHPFPAENHGLRFGSAYPDFIFLDKSLRQKQVSIGQHKLYSLVKSDKTSTKLAASVSRPWSHPFSFMIPPFINFLCFIFLVYFYHSDSVLLWRCCNSPEYIVHSQVPNVSTKTTGWALVSDIMPTDCSQTIHKTALFARMEALRSARASSIHSLKVFVLWHHQQSIIDPNYGRFASICPIFIALSLF